MQCCKLDAQIPADIRFCWGRGPDFPGPPPSEPLKAWIGRNSMEGGTYYGGPGGFALSTQNDVPMAANLSFGEAATLPCAGVTAWNAIFASSNQLKPGDTVLLLGTGGVSVLGMQLARAAGRRVVRGRTCRHRVCSRRFVMRPSPRMGRSTSPMH